MGRIMVWGECGQIPWAKIDGRCGSSGRAPALWAQSPEFKPSSHTHTHTPPPLIYIWIWYFWSIITDLTSPQAFKLFLG
jgi:hypothetical protein